MTSPQTQNSLIATGLAIGLNQLTNLQFDINCPWTCCRICGAVFQSGYDRMKGDIEHNVMAMEMRREWSVLHARLHTEREHLSLAISGRWCTPEAAHKMAAFGIIPVKDMVLDNEIEDAMLKSSPIPVDDVEGT